MSRFDEFCESLQEAKGHLEEAVDCLENDDFDSEEARYGATNEALSSAWSSLWEACMDISDDVGIRCDTAKLKDITNNVEILERRAWIDAENSLDDEKYDYHKCRGYIQSIRALQSDIDRISSEAR